jgi:putative FmdB family regulatory protein
MPNYDYVCTSCKGEFEFFQSMKDAPLEQCPSCEELTLKRKIGTGAGIIFKGSGFYETDYKKSAKEPANLSQRKNQAKVLRKEDLVIRVDAVVHLNPMIYVL